MVEEKMNSADAVEPEAVESTVAEEKTDKAEKKKNKKLETKISELESKLASAEEALAEQSDKYMRMAAEYDNFRKRSAKEKQDTYADAYGDALATALPILDNLERAAAYTDGAQLVDGIKLIFKSAKESFEKIGVTEYGAPGEDFDPNLHNAVQQVESEEYTEGKIVSVYQKGYKKGDRILREAIVAVAQ